MDYKIILLDLDDTVFDFKLGENKAIIETLNFFNIKYDETIIKKFSELNEFYFQKYASKEMSREEFHYARFHDILRLVNSSVNPLDVNKFYLDNLALQCEFMPGALELIKELSSKYILCAASNGKYDVQLSRIKKAGIEKYFDKIYVSSSIGANKPDVEFFNYIFNDYNNYLKSDFLIIGDRFSSDILGGINAGIDTCLYNYRNEKSDIVPTYSFETLDKIRKFLK